MEFPDLDDPVDLRMNIEVATAAREPGSRGNFLARVTLGAAIAFVEGQPEAERWRFTAELGSRAITHVEMAEIWGTREFGAWLDGHD